METKSTEAIGALLLSAFLHGALIVSLPPSKERPTSVPQGPVSLRVVEPRRTPPPASIGGLQGTGGSGGSGIPASRKARPRPHPAMPAGGIGHTARADSAPGIPVVEGTGSGSKETAGAMVAAIAPVEGPPALQASPTDQALEKRRNDYALMVRRALEGAGQYPAIARRNHLEGKVVVRIRVDISGRIESVGLHQSSAHKVLDEAALALARRLRSLPPPPGGPIEIAVPVVFALH